MLQPGKVLSKAGKAIVLVCKGERPVKVEYNDGIAIPRETLLAVSST